MTIKGIIITHNGKETEVELEYEIIMRDNRRLFRILNGVTGFESFYIDPNHRWKTETVQAFEKSIHDMKVHGWLACSGMGFWDKLFIPSEEMKKALP